MTVGISAPSSVAPRESFTVRGRVFEDGRWLDYVDVEIYVDGSLRTTTTTSAIGEYSSAISISTPGTHMLRARALGVWSSQRTITVELLYVRVTISAPSTVEAGESFVVSGRVYNYQTGESYAGVSVSLFLDERGEASVTTRSDGSYTRSYTIVDLGRHLIEARVGASWAEVTVNIVAPYVPPTPTPPIPTPPPPTPPPPLPPEPIGAITQILDFVVPDTLPAGSTVTVMILLRNTGALGYLDYYIDGNPSSPDRYIGIEAGRTPTTVSSGAAVWVDVPFRYFNMPAWDFRLTASNEDGTSSISQTIMLGVVVPPVPPEEPPEIPPEEPPLVLPIIAGRILDVGYWYEGLESWRDLETQYVPLEMGKELYFGPRWINDGNIDLRGHVDLEVTSPTGVKHLPYAVLNQDRTTDPNSGFGVQFAPLLVNEVGSWSLRIILTLEGSPSVLGDEKYYTFYVIEAPPIPPGVVPPGVPPVVPPLLPPIVPPEVPPAVPPAVPMLPPDVEHMTDRLKMMLWILYDIKDEIRPIAIKANTYSILTVDLSVAHLAFQTHHRLGFAITVLKCTGTIELKIGDLSPDAITIDPLIYPQTIIIDMMDFAKLYSRNTAQPGREAVLIIWRRE